MDDKAEAQNSKKAELVEVEDEDTKEEEPLPPFPSTIDGFGYTFNESQYSASGSGVSACVHLVVLCSMFAFTLI